MTTTTTDTVNINEEGLLQYRVVSLRTLRVLNKESVKRGYNRNLWIKEFEKDLKEKMNKSPDVSWRGLKTEVLLIPVLIHEHKGGEPCEAHIRSQISTGGLLSEPFLDIPIEMFEDLKVITPDIPKRPSPSNENNFIPKLVVDNT